MCITRPTLYVYLKAKRDPFCYFITSIAMSGCVPTMPMDSFIWTTVAKIEKKTNIIHSSKTKNHFRALELLYKHRHEKILRDMIAMMPQALLL